MPGDERQLGGRLRELVEVCDYADQGSEASGRRGEAGGGGEVVHGDETEWECGEFGEGRVCGFERCAEGAQGGEAGVRPR